MNERYPAAPRTFGLREAHWQTIERLSPSAPSRFTAIDLWWEECERAVHVEEGTLVAELLDHSRRRVA